MSLAAGAGGTPVVGYVVIDESVTVDPAVYEKLRGVVGRGRVAVFTTAQLCRCGAPVTDGPFRFCVRCRQVDLTMIV